MSPMKKEKFAALLMKFVLYLITVHNTEIEV